MNSLSLDPQAYALPSPDCKDSGWLPSPAKINLFLHIVNQLPNGYHELQTVFSLISAHDALRFEVCDQADIKRHDIASDIHLQIPAQDLCVKAAHLLQKTTQCTQGVSIYLKKNVPAQAGLGGGSSNAATTLIALNHLWKLHLPLSTLMQLGKQLGADVPFFLSGQSSAWAQGIGEELSPLTLPPFRCAIIKPQAGIATADIFAHPQLERHIRRVKMDDFVSQLNQANQLNEALMWGRNVLQDVAITLEPSIQESLDGLKALGLQGRMTGSGSAVFAIVPPSFNKPIDTPFAQWSGCFQSLTIHPLTHWINSI